MSQCSSPPWTQHVALKKKAPVEIELDKVIRLGAGLSRFRPHLPLTPPPRPQPGSNIVVLHQTVTNLLQSLLPPLHTILLLSSLNP